MDDGMDISDAERIALNQMDIDDVAAPVEDVAEESDVRSVGPAARSIGNGPTASLGATFPMAACSRIEDGPRPEHKPRVSLSRWRRLAQKTSQQSAASSVLPATAAVEDGARELQAAALTSKRCEEPPAKRPHLGSIRQTDIRGFLTREVAASAACDVDLNNQTHPSPGLREVERRRSSLPTAQQPAALHQSTAATPTDPSCNTMPAMCLGQTEPGVDAPPPEPSPLSCPQPAPTAHAPDSVRRANFKAQCVPRSPAKRLASSARQQGASSRLLAPPPSAADEGTTPPVSPVQPSPFPALCRSGQPSALGFFSDPALDDSGEEIEAGPAVEDVGTATATGVAAAGQRPAQPRTLGDTHAADIPLPRSTIADKQRRRRLRAEQLAAWRKREQRTAREARIARRLTDSQQSGSQESGDDRPRAVSFRDDRNETTIFDPLCPLRDPLLSPRPQQTDQPADDGEPRPNTSPLATVDNATPPSCTTFSRHCTDGLPHAANATTLQRLGDVGAVTPGAAEEA
jgi:hypothetical protein